MNLSIKSALNQILNHTNTQATAAGASASSMFSFGNSGASTAPTPFGTSQQPSAAPTFGSSTPSVGSSNANAQPTTGFNFAANANTAVPGVFQFGAASPPSNPQAPASSFSFGSAISNAPGFGSPAPSIGQPAASPGGMFSIGASGNNANTKGRTFRTATRRRPK